MFSPCGVVLKHILAQAAQGNQLVRSSRGCRSLKVNQPKANPERLIDPVHSGGVQYSKTLPKPLAINGPDLAQFDARSGGEAISLRGRDDNFNGMGRRRHLGGDGGHNRDRAVTVRNVVLPMSF